VQTPPSLQQSSRDQLSAKEADASPTNKVQRADYAKLLTVGEAELTSARDEDDSESVASSSLQDKLNA